MLNCFQKDGASFFPSSPPRAGPGVEEQPLQPPGDGALLSGNEPASSSHSSSLAQCHTKRFVSVSTFLEGHSEWWMLLCRSWGGFFFSPFFSFFSFVPWIASLGGLLASFIWLLWLQIFPNCCEPASSTTPLWPKQDIHDWLAWGSWITSSYFPQQSCSLPSPWGLKYPVVLVSFLSGCTSAKAYASSCDTQGCFSAANCDRGFI